MYTKVTSDYLGELHAFEFTGNTDSLCMFLGKNFNLVSTSFLGATPCLMLTDNENNVLTPFPIFERFWVFKSVRTGDFVGFSLDLNHFLTHNSPPAQNIDIQKILTEKQIFS